MLHVNNIKSNFSFNETNTKDLPCDVFHCVLCLLVVLLFFFFALLHNYCYSRNKTKRVVKHKGHASPMVCKLFNTLSLECVFGLPVLYLNSLKC